MTVLMIMSLMSLQQLWAFRPWDLRVWKNQAIDFLWPQLRFYNESLKTYLELVLLMAQLVRCMQRLSMFQSSGNLYFQVANRTRPSLQIQIFSGSQPTRRQQTLRSNLRPLYNSGLGTYFWTTQCSYSQISVLINILFTIDVLGDEDSTALAVCLWLYDVCFEDSSLSGLGGVGFEF